MDVLGRFWDRVTAVVPDLPTSVLLGTAAAAALLVGFPTLWRLTRHAVTIAHEGAHGAVALAAGRRLSGIRLHSDTSGLTVSAGRPTGVGMVLTLAAGYTGPALFGLGAAALLAAGHAVGLLWALLMLLALLLLQIRNLYGFAVVVGTGVVLVAVSWYVPATGQAILAYVLTWLLLLSAPRPVIELARQRRLGRARNSDADQLARLTRLPAPVWVAGFLVANLGGLVLAVTWLLPEMVRAAGAWLGGLQLD